MDDFTLIQGNLILAVVVSRPTMIALMLVFASLVVAWTKGFKTLCQKSSGWKAITAKFPAATTLNIGQTYKRQDGVIGDSNYRQSFNIQLTADGVRVCPGFARQMPILIPWSGIRSVTGGQWSLLVTVDYERTLQFYLPGTALAVVKENVPAERWHKGVSIFEGLKAAIKANPGVHYVGWRPKSPSPAKVSATTNCAGCHAPIPAGASVCPKCGRGLW